MRVTFDECNDTAEVCGLFNKVFANQEQLEAKIIQLDKQMQTRATKSWVGKLLQPKKKEKEEKKGTEMKSKGSASMRVIAILMLIVALAGLGYAAYVPTDINYEIASNPEMLATYLRDVTGTMISDSYLFTPTLAADAPPFADGRVWYNNTDNILQMCLDGATWTDIALAGGNSLGAAYNVGEEITADSGTPVTITVPDNGNNYGLFIVNNDITNDPDSLYIDHNPNLNTSVAIQIESAAGVDIRGTGDSWNVSRLGVATLVGLDVGASHIVMLNDETIINDTDREIQFGCNSANSEDISFHFGDNNGVISLDTDTAATIFNFNVFEDVNGMENIIFDNAACTITIDGNVDGHDLTIQHTADVGTDDSSLILTSAGTGDDALKFIASVAGIDVDAVGSIVITSTENAADSIVIQSTAGGIDIICDAAGPGEDIDITSVAGSVNISSTENDAASIVIQSTLGGIDILADASGGEDIDISNTGGSVHIVSDLAGPTAINIDATGVAGGVDVDTTSGPIVLTAADGTNGDITLDAADVMTFTSVDTKIFDGAATELWIIQGTAAGAYHSISFTDATANVVWTFPDGGAGTVGMMSTSLATNFVDIADSVTGGSNEIIFEGSDEDSEETIIRATDPTADIIWLLPDGLTDTLAFMGSTLETNYPEVANSVWGASNAIHFEGTDDGFEIILSAAEATTSDKTATIPNITGQIMLASAGSVVTPAAGATLTVGLSNLYTLTPVDNEDSVITFSGAGTAGEILILVITTTGAADEDISFHATLVSSAGALTVGTTAARYYVITFVSDGSHWYEMSRTAELT